MYRRPLQEARRLFGRKTNSLPYKSRQDALGKVLSSRPRLSGSVRRRSRPRQAADSRGQGPGSNNPSRNSKSTNSSIAEGEYRPSNGKSPLATPRGPQAALRNVSKSWGSAERLTPLIPPGFSRQLTLRFYFCFYLFGAPVTRQKLASFTCVYKTAVCVCDQHLLLSSHVQHCNGRQEAGRRCVH